MTESVLTLDMGCGQKKECDVNVDINPKVKPDIVSDFLFLPLKNTSFSKVRFEHSLEHVPQPKTALRETHRILKPGGVLTVQFPNHLAFSSLINIIKGDPFLNDPDTDYSPDKHFRFFTIINMAYLFIISGFRPFKIKKDPRYQKYRMMKWLYSIFPFFCPDIILNGRKR